MSDVAVAILRKVHDGNWQVTSHARGRMAEKSISMADVLTVTENGAVIETNRGDHLGPSALVSGRSEADLPLHVLWGMIDSMTGPAYLVTAYWPDPLEWSAEFTARRTK